jgi:hypothetical protein
MRRAIFHILIALSFLYLPWYITALFILSFAIVTGLFIEAFIWALFTDVIYGSTVSMWGISYVFSLTALIVLPLIALMRRRVSW